MIGAGETSRGRTGQHARRSRKHCKPCAGHAHAPPPRARTRLHKFHSVGNSNQHLPVQCNNELNRQRDGAGETSRTRQITSCLRRDGQHARPSHKHCKACVKHAHAPPPRARACLRGFHVVEHFKPTRTSPSETTSRNTNVIGAAETSRNHKLRVAWHGLGNTRAVCANTANRAPNMLTHHRHVRVHVCTVSI